MVVRLASKLKISLARIYSVLQTKCQEKKISTFILKKTSFAISDISNATICFQYLTNIIRLWDMVFTQATILKNTKFLWLNLKIDQLFWTVLVVMLSRRETANPVLTQTLAEVSSPELNLSLSQQWMLMYWFFGGLIISLDRFYI